MFQELITYLTTSCPQYVRRMGYLYQAIALRGRFKRRHKSWRPHLEKTQKYVIQTAELCRNRARVVILGSGLLLDVPLETLSGMFEEVVLADVVHLPEVCRHIRQYGNVRLVQSDITGVAKKLFRNTRRGLNELPQSIPVIPGIDEFTGLVVSLNILSQLAAIPLDFVLKRKTSQNEAMIDGWCDQIREAHYAALKALPCDVCLVADYEYARKDREGNVVEKGSTVGELSLPVPDTSWTWEIAPIGEESPGLSRELHVGAWHFSNRRTRLEAPAL